MKKTLIVCSAICVALAFVGCKSSEKEYRKAYEKAMAQDAKQNASQAPETVATENVVAPVIVQEATQKNVVSNASNGNVKVKEENVTMVSGSGLKKYSVVVGAFSVRGNAEGLQRTLKNAGFDAQIVVNTDVTPAMYRVCATTFDSYQEAVNSRNILLQRYEGAWLLYKK